MKNIFKILGVMLLAIAFAFSPNKKKTLIIDAGHGGKDNGAIINGISEKDIVLSVAKKIKTLSKDTNIDVVLIREDNQLSTLSERTEKINSMKADYVISLHANNSKNLEKHGKEIIICDKNEQYAACKHLANLLYESFGGKDIEIKEKNLHLLRNVKHPIVTLEMGYLSNENDRKTITSEDGQMEIAKTILNALQ